MLFGFLLSDGDAHFGNQRSLQKLNYGGCTLKLLAEVVKNSKSFLKEKYQCIGHRSVVAWCVVWFLLSDGDTHFGNQCSLQKLNYICGCTLKLLEEVVKNSKPFLKEKYQCVGQRSGGDDGSVVCCLVLAFRW